MPGQLAVNYKSGRFGSPGAVTKRETCQQETGAPTLPFLTSTAD